MQRNFTAQSPESSIRYFENKTNVPERMISTSTGPRRAEALSKYNHMQSRREELKTMAFSISPEMRGPTPAQTLSKPRSPACKSALTALQRTNVLEIEPTLSTWTPHKKENVFLATKSKFQDPQAQRAHAAREISLGATLYKDPVIFQYGILPDQAIPRPDANQLHPVDWLDATLNSSLSMKELATKKKKIPAWDGTNTNIVREKLWRRGEPIT